MKTTARRTVPVRSDEPSRWTVRIPVTVEVEITVTATDEDHARTLVQGSRGYRAVALDELAAVVADLAPADLPARWADMTINPTPKGTA